MKITIKKSLIVMVMAIALLLSVFVSVCLTADADTAPASIKWGDGDTVPPEGGWATIIHQAGISNKSSADYAMSASKAWEFSVPAYENNAYRMTIAAAKGYANIGTLPDLTSIPSENLTLSFWVYAEDEITFHTSFYIQIGFGGDGGYIFTPAEGAFAKNAGGSSVLKKGWNHFYVGMNSALADSTYGTSYYSGGTGIKAYCPDIETESNTGKYFYLDFYRFAVAENTDSAKMYIDDIKFVNTAKLDEVVQTVKRGDALEAVANDGIYGNIALGADIALTQNLILTNDCAVTTGEYSVNYGEYKILAAAGVTATVDGIAVETVSEDAPVTGVTLNTNAAEVYEGGSLTLTAGVAPSEAVNKAVTWSSSDAAVASVVNGKVTALKPGSATITVTTEDGGFTDTCIVTVKGTEASVKWADGDTVAYDKNGNFRGWTSMYHSSATPDVTDADYAVSSSQAWAFTLTAEAQTNQRISIRVGDYVSSPDISGIPSENLAFSFWIYAENSAVIDTGSYMRLGGASDGGFNLSPLSGAFSKNKDGLFTLQKGWNHFYVDFGRALSENTGEAVWVSEAGVFLSNFPGVDKQPNIGRYSYFDLYKIKLVAGSSDTNIYIDDMKFVNTAKLDEIVQTVKAVDQLYAAVSDGTYKNIALGADITLNGNIILSNNCAITTGDYSLNLNGYKVLALEGVTATLDGAAVEIVSDDIEVEGVSLSQTSVSLYEGGTLTLTASVMPAEATNTAVTWASSDAEVVSVVNGKLTALKPGSATITVTTEDGGKTAECSVTVNESLASIEFLNSDTEGADGWKFTQHQSGAGSLDMDITVSSSSSFVGLYGADLPGVNGTGLTRSSFRNSSGVSLKGIPLENLAFTFWVYAEEDVTFKEGFYLRLGRAGAGGWNIYPASGPFAATGTTVKAGWNYFCFDIGAAYAGDASAGRIEYARGENPGELGYYDNCETIADAMIFYFDIYGVDLPDGSEDINLYFDDLKFINTAKTDELYQGANQELILNRLLSDENFKNISITSAITLKDTVTISRDVNIDAGGTQMKVAEGKSLFVIDGATVNFNGGNFSSTNADTLFKVVNGGALNLTGTIRAANTEKIIYDVEKGSTVSFADATVRTLGKPASLTKVNGEDVYLIAKLPKDTATGTVFADYKKYSDADYDYYYAEIVYTLTVTAPSAEINAGESLTLTAEVNPDNIERTFIWSVSGSDKATIGADGKLNVAEDAGDCTLTVTVKTSDDALSASKTITVKAKPAEGDGGNSGEGDNSPSAGADNSDNGSTGLIIGIAAGVAVIAGGAAAIIILKKKKM